MWCNEFWSGGWSASAGRRGGGFEGGFAGFWGAGGRGGWGGGRGGRLFAQGDLKFVLLRLLDEKPRHGYDVIKALEELFAGMYSPSPGTIYPTLTMLEDLGYARATPEAGGRRIYEITAEGKAYLEQHRETVDEIFRRAHELSGGRLGAPMAEVHAAFKEVARAAFAAAVRSSRDPERLRRIRDALERAAREIDEAGR